MFVKHTRKQTDSFVALFGSGTATRYYILDFQVVMIGQGMRGIFGMIDDSQSEMRRMG